MLSRYTTLQATFQSTVRSKEEKKRRRNNLRNRFQRLPRHRFFSFDRAVRWTQKRTFVSKCALINHPLLTMTM